MVQRGTPLKNLGTLSFFKMKIKSYRKKRYKNKRKRLQKDKGWSSGWKQFKNNLKKNNWILLVKMRRKRNYAMVKLNQPKRVNLPDGRSFVARYKRISRDELPPNIIMRRTYRQRAAPRGRRRRPSQGGQGIFSFLKKAAKNPLVRTLAKKGLEYAPGIYHNLSKRVKNKTSSRVLNSDAAHLLLSRGIKAANSHLQ